MQRSALGLSEFNKTPTVGDNLIVCIAIVSASAFVSTPDHRPINPGRIGKRVRHDLDKSITRSNTVATSCKIRKGVRGTWLNNSITVPALLSFTTMKDGTPE
jgi:hypothetical protein